MTEREWGACEDPERMLQALKGKASDRKLRLLTAACCGSIVRLLAHERLRWAVETLERYADGQAAYHDMVQAAKAAESAGWSLIGGERLLAEAAWSATAMNLWHWFRPRWRTARTLCLLLTYDECQASHQAALVRCIFGDSFRLVTLQSDRFERFGESVYAMARRSYDDRDFGELSRLAEALEKAGCTDAALLDHLRGPGPHVRGCWALDLILGKR